MIVMMVMMMMMITSCSSQPTSVMAGVTGVLEVSVSIEASWLVEAATEALTYSTRSSRKLYRSPDMAVPQSAPVYLEVHSLD